MLLWSIFYFKVTVDKNTQRCGRGITLQDMQNTTNSLEKTYDEPCNLQRSTLNFGSTTRWSLYDKSWWMPLYCTIVAKPLVVMQEVSLNLHHSIVCYLSDPERRHNILSQQKWCPLCFQESPCRCPREGWRKHYAVDVSIVESFFQCTSTAKG